MKFRVGGVYSHKKMLDCKIYVRKVRSSSWDDREGTTRILSVLWFTKQGTLITDDQFEVRDDAEGWYEVEE